MSKFREDTPVERMYNGILKENPTLVLMLGMCPTLAVTTSAVNGLGMGLATTAVLMMSNMFISMLCKVIPNRVRIPAFIVIIATFVTIVQLLLEAYIPFLNQALGMYIPLIVVNCIILGRAESYAYSHKVIASFFDGLGMGLGFTVSLTIMGALREALGAGKIFGYAILPGIYTPISIFALAPGAFFVLAALAALRKAIWMRKPRKRPLPEGCGADCATCGISGCVGQSAHSSNVVKQSAEKAQGIISDHKEGK
ncbi:MAG: electron transport complex subunit E [Lachnospiraceae bacterium]|nr:electron transport complex subunit E [Lachnospiraceae bacterium]